MVGGVTATKAMDLLGGVKTRIANFLIHHCVADVCGVTSTHDASLSR